jgi:deoxycytidine triphosphate deaminase
MTIIHLQGRNTSDETLFNAQKSSQVSMLLVNEEAKVERFSLELTVGTAWASVFSPSQKNFVQIDSRGVKIGRHDSIVIEVAEDIHVPNNMYGILVPTGSLFLGLGILIAPAKIEPGFSGKLTLRLFNTTAEKYTLKTEQKLGSAIFFATDTTVDHETLKRERGVSLQTYPFYARLWHWLKTNPLSWIPWIITLIGSSTSAVLITTFLLRNNPPPNAQPSAQTAAQQQAKPASQTTTTP